MKKQVKRRSETGESISPFKENLAKFFFDLAKAVFTISVITQIAALIAIGSLENDWFLYEISFGIVTTTCLAAIASRLLKS